MIKNMKIIDLLNKIANGEDVPKKIKFEGTILLFQKDVKKYWDENLEVNLNDILSRYTGEFLNDEAEIIEEDKKIEKIDKAEYNAWDKDDILDKINEIIDKLNEGDK